MKGENIITKTQNVGFRTGRSKAFGQLIIDSWQIFFPFKESVVDLLLKKIDQQTYQMISTITLLAPVYTNHLWIRYSL